MGDQPIQESLLEAERGPQTGMQLITSMLEKLLQADDHPRVVGIGIGSTGPTDPIQGLIVNPGTLPGWVNVPIVSWLEQRFQVPACLENDADAAALGEYWQGAGKGARRLYAITVGTGIGTACIIDGKVYRGAGGFHPEGGHLIVDPGGPACYCGGRGCWESLASGTAIAESMRRQLGKQPGADLPNAKAIAEAARQGHPLARRVIESAAESFALGVFTVLMTFFPELIVLSGGVMRSYDLFQPAIERALQDASVYLPVERVQIVQAQLGYYAGIYGAAYAIMKRNHDGLSA